jgi:cell division septal protein FtsQ
MSPPASRVAARGRAHPALAARRRQIARARSRRRRVSLLTVLGVAAAVAVLWWALSGPLTAIRSVEVTGYDRPDQGELQRALRAAADEGSMLRLPTGALRAAAQPFPWVGEVSVARDWPAGVRVAVTPARPVAVVTGPGADPVLVTGDGRVLGPAGKEPRLARIGVREEVPPYGGRLGADARAALQLAAGVEPGVARRLRELRMAEGQLLGRLVDGPELRLGGPGRMVAKATALGLVLNQLSAEDEAAAEYIDLTLPERPAVGGIEAMPEEVLEAEGSSVG